MRSEKEMYNILINLASQDERVLAVYMNGSRTNTNVPKDIFQDYDIVYVVTETSSFIEDKKWLKNFGQIMYMQKPDEFPNASSDTKNSYAWLMQFEDGIRLDLHVQTLEHTLKNIKKDKLCKILLDKFAYLPKISEANDEQYHVQRPSETEFLAACNEFWWCTNNLAKGLWRSEILYVQDMANFIVRKELEKLLTWKIGILTNFSVSVGKSAKYMGNYLSSEDYTYYLKTFFDSSIDNAWEAILLMCDLFSHTARWVSEELVFSYNLDEEQAALKFLYHVKSLPKDAKKIF